MNLEEMERRMRETPTEFLKFRAVRVERKFAITTTFLDTTLYSEDQASQYETDHDVQMRLFWRLEETANALRKEYQSSKGYMSGEAISESLRTSAPIGPPMPQVINLENERLEIQIDNCGSLVDLYSLFDAAVKADLMVSYYAKAIILCTSVDVLATFKESASKYGLVLQYMNRKKHLER